jgi:2-oxo-4-hydroxy-4-carboxy-5-ureidoimidazoline decarboxylase
VTPEEAGRLDRDAFVERFGDLYEHSPWIAEAAWEQRPFERVEDLHRAFEGAVAAAPLERKLDLIRSHPELAGREAEEGSLTPDSTSEQASAGLDRLSPEEVARLRELNTAYREAFGFPMVVAVREHTKDSIFAQAEARLARPREQEISAALAEIAKIARLRLGGLVSDNTREEQ